MANDSSTLEWLKRMDREDAAKDMMWAIHYATLGGKNSPWYKEQARKTWEQGLNKIERLAKLNWEGRA